MKTNVDFNTALGVPRTYHFKRFLRWFTILMGLLAVVYSFYLIYNSAFGTEGFRRYIPYAIMFLALNSLLKNLFTLNKVVINKANVVFGFLLKPSVKIEYNSISRIEFNAIKRKAFKIHYFENGMNKIYWLTIAFPKMLEIINSIIAECPEAEYDEFVSNILMPGLVKKHESKQ